MTRRREDTVVSRLPNRFVRAATQVSQVARLPQAPGDDFEDEATRAEGPGSVDTSARRAMAALDGVPMPANWGAAPPPRPLPPPVPQTEDERSEIHTQMTFRPGAGSAADDRPYMPSPEPAPGQPRLAEASQGDVIVMFGCRGGAGATTLAVNTAACLARAGKRVCVMDLDLQLGDVFVALDLEAETSIAALAREASTIDGAALVRRLARHDAGFYALTQTGRIDDIDPQLVERLPALIATLTDHFDYVIVDGVRDFSDYALSVLDMADRVAMVMTQDVAAVRRAARVITLFRQLGYSTDKLALVLNRRHRKSPVDEAEIERALGLRIAATVRNDYKRVRQAVDDGALLSELAKTSKIAKDVAALTRQLAGPQALASESRQLVDQALSPAKPKKSIFGNLFARTREAHS